MLLGCNRWVLSLYHATFYSRYKQESNTLLDIYTLRLYFYCIVWMRILTFPGFRVKSHPSCCWTIVVFYVIPIFFICAMELGINLRKSCFCQIEWHFHHHRFTLGWLTYPSISLKIVGIALRFSNGVCFIIKTIDVLPTYWGSTKSWIGEIAFLFRMVI